MSLFVSKQHGAVLRGTCILQTYIFQRSSEKLRTIFNNYGTVFIFSWFSSFSLIVEAGLQNMYRNQNHSQTKQTYNAGRHIEIQIHTHALTFFACVPRFSFESTRVCSVYAFRNKPKKHIILWRLNPLGRPAHAKAYV